MSARMAILFDLDGTLLDTAPEFTHCLNLLLAQEDKSPIQLEQLRSTISFGANGMIELGFNLSLQDPYFQILKQRLLQIYLQDIGFQTTFFPGVELILQQIEKANLVWGIVTNKPKAYTFPLLEKFAPLHQAPCIIAGDTLATQKPDPAPLLHACELLNISPKNCWYVGDAHTDLQAGRRAGMACAIANYGYIPHNQNVLDWQADKYLATAHEIADLIRG